ncbi:MAG: hypothetical protein WCQ54_13215 [Clostridiaceae bacterium]
MHGIGGRKTDYKQVIEQESQETNINIDYFEKKVRIYTNKATVMNRMEKAGYKPVEVESMDNKPCSCTYEFSFIEFPRLISTSMFKCD